MGMSTLGAIKRKSLKGGFTSNVLKNFDMKSSIVLSRGDRSIDGSSIK
jgi:hypothetical protein